MKDNRVVYKKINDESNKFANVEVLWFWFVASKRIKTGLIARNNEIEKRPCEVVDIEIVVTKLNLAGNITCRQIKVITRYGFLRRAPNPNFRHEERDALDWTVAMDVIKTAANEKEWLE